MGRPTALPSEVELKIVTSIKTMEKWGFGLSKIVIYVPRA
jgi:hypothetical protein